MAMLDRTDWNIPNTIIRSRAHSHIRMAGLYCHHSVLQTLCVVFVIAMISYHMMRKQSDYH